MKVGYVRVSSADQNPARQLVGVDVERTFTDAASGRDQDRPQLEALLGFVRDGDHVYVHSLDRLARNLADLRALVERVNGKGVAVTFITEQLTFTGQDSPMANLLLNVMGAFAEFERALIRERQAEGIAAAKARGVYKGRPPALTPTQSEQIRRRVAAGASKAGLAREYRVSRDTIYRVLRV